MFRKDNHCMTIGIGEELPEEQQQLLWDNLDSFLSNNKEEQVDRFQIYKMSVIQVNGSTMQQVIHIQEYPSLIEENTYAVDKPVDSTVFIYLENSQ